MIRYLTSYTKNCNLPRCRMWRTKMNTGHQQQGVTLVELRELRILPAEFLHVVRVFYSGWIRGVPYLISW